MINKVILVGRLGKDPELRVFENGNKVISATIATTSNYKDKNDEWQEETEWTNVSLWNKLADSFHRFAKKGSLVYLEGKIKTRKYQDSSGVDKWSTEVVCNKFQRLEFEKENILNKNLEVLQEAISGTDDLPF